MRARTLLTSMRRASLDHDELRLPGKVKFKLLPQDRAVYLGSLRYHRDAYTVITRVEVIDDHDRANREFSQRLGTAMQLRQAVVHAAR